MTVTKPATAIELPAHFDLRDYLPTAGEQAQGDCVAWAIAHVVYTCQVAQERRQQPLDSCDLFSPAFIRAQLRGDDDGLAVAQAIELVQRQGCATRATMPLSSCEVSPEARHEANRFRALRSERLTSLDQLKAGICDGCPVVLVVRMGGDFRCDAVNEHPYRWQNEADPRPGYHAVAAVGFDDRQAAVLLLNSWGTQWKDNGFCWAAYANFDRIDDEAWCAEAHRIGVKRSLPATLTMATADGERSQLRPIHRFQRRVIRHAADGKVYESGQLISPDQWAFDDIACNQTQLFALGRDQTVYRMNESPNGTSWTQLDRGPIADKKVTMIAGDRLSELWALTGDKKLFQYQEASEEWGLAALPDPAAKPIDLRTLANRVHVTTDDGRGYRHDPENGWADAF
ncbi:C1 family peptidase [Allorhodopirellula solitaria]|uniref:Papain family cysteine protease n=1 Tax=Allorhodopirellula solitaria TaxID=2527987 RepID=A0A5C5XUK9_9BACT|nr:C1 family peptidase [Allorhodopirellula solitaria]TWT66408.1 Papain family cysteine protease [Allorhodopirellula solitaria]